MYGCDAIDMMCSNDAKMRHVDLLLGMFLNNRHPSETVGVTRPLVPDFLQTNRRQKGKWI